MLDEEWEIVGTGYGMSQSGKSAYIGYLKKDLPVLYTSEILPDILRGLKEKKLCSCPICQ